MSGRESDGSSESDHNTEDVHFGRVAIIGMGLMGGSFAAALQKQGLADHVCAFDRDPGSLEQALSMGLIHESADSIQSAVDRAQLIVVAVPVLSMTSVFEGIHQADRADNCLITDLGSVKSHVLETARQAFGDLPANLVPGHPIAGSEQHGVEAANADLFIDHKVILTPANETAPEAVQAISDLWQVLGSEVVLMDAAHHDDVLAQTSHLPHLLAYALVDCLCNQPDGREIFQYAAGGFRDFSRIAASDPIMWRDIFQTNREAVLAILDKFTDDLAAIRQLIDDGEMEGLTDKFAKAKAARDYFSTMINSTPPNTTPNKTQDES